MKIYVPLVAFEPSNDELELSDFVFFGYKEEADAKILHPDAPILEVEVMINPQAN